MPHPRGSPNKTKSETQISWTLDLEAMTEVPEMEIHQLMELVCLEILSKRILLEF